MLRPALDVPNAVLTQPLLEGRLAAPGGVLTPVVGQHLLRHPVFRHGPLERLEDELRLLVMGDHVRDDEARVVVHERGHVDALVASQQKREDVALPHLVGAGPLEATRALGLAFPGGRHHLQQPLLVQHPTDRRVAHAQRSQASEDVSDATCAPVGVFLLRLDDRLSPRIAVECSVGFLATGAVRDEPVQPVRSVPSDPIRQRLRPDPEQCRSFPQARLVLGDLPDYPKSKFDRIGIPGAALRRPPRVDRFRPTTSSLSRHFVSPFPRPCSVEKGGRC